LWAFFVIIGQVGKGSVGVWREGAGSPQRRDYGG
jgi:hypothetical protein